MTISIVEQVRPGSELFIAQQSKPQNVFASLSVALIGNLPCKTPDGDLQYFDPYTEFVSYCFASLVGTLVSVAIVLPTLYRIYELMRHEKGSLTAKGQIAKVTAILTPVAYLSKYLFKGGSPSIMEWVIGGTGFFVGILHHVQEGRVTVCSPELLLYWAGIIPAYLSIAIDSYLSGEKASWVNTLPAGLSIVTFVLELTNSARSPKDTFADANIFSKASVAYANNLIQKGVNNQLAKEDYPEVPAEYSSLNGYAKFEEKLNSTSQTSKYRVLWALTKLSSDKLFAYIVIDILDTLVSYLQPSILGLFLGSLVKFTLGSAPIFPSFYFAILLGVTPVIITGLENLSQLYTTYTYVLTRVALISTIYHKSLNLSPASREKFDSAKIMNLINVDSEQVDGVVNYIPTLITAPLAVVASTWQLWRLLGPSMFASLIIYAIVLPLTAQVSMMMRKYFPEQMKIKDTRNKLTSNIFRNIKSLKLYAWEKPFYERVKEVRDEELSNQRSTIKLSFALGLTWNMTSDLIAAAVFVMFLYLKQGALTPDVVFPSLMLLQLATIPFMVLPMALTGIFRAVTSQGRINELLLEADQDHANYFKLSEAAHGYEEPALIVENASLSWNGETTPNKVILDNVTFSAARGDLVCITGRVGSGKTGLLKALAGELAVTGGSVTIKGSLAYCTQEVWLQNLSLRDNILFGQKFDQDWYDRVIDSCELLADIKQLPKGDLTDVGERGISLSGGQQARVALARAVYSRADVFLFDDVLSAVDEHVSGNLIRKLLGSDGLLANRTIVLATNNVKVLSHSSLILALEGKRVVAADPFKEVVRQRKDSKIYRLIEEFGHAADLAQEAEHVEDRKAAVTAHELNDPNFHPAGLHSKPLEVGALNLRLSSDDDEEKETQAVSLWIFKRYFAFLKPWYLLIFLGSLPLSVIITNSANIFLGYMSNQALETLGEAKWYLTAYMTIVVVSAIGIIFTQFWAQLVMALRISRTLHNSMLWNLMHSPMQFFDATPLGRLINRFTGDIATLDTQFPTTLYYTTRSLMNVVMNVVTILSGSPVMIFVIVPLTYFGNLYRKLYVPSSRKVSRMASSSNSPILSHIEESLKGQTLIRTFDRKQQFLSIYDQRVDYWITLAFLRTNIPQWLSFRIQAITAILMLGTAVSATYLVSINYLTVGYSAVVIHFATRAGIMVKQTLSFLAQAEVSGVSLERILDYVDCKQEAAAHIAETEPAREWPNKGELVFKEFSARYTEDGPDVLKKLTFAINGGEKIGIVGRTGSGKSSLTMAIFRILEAHEGHIEIDGSDTSKLGLHDLRSKLSIIPQDAQIFEGTVRENVDPLSTSDDARLWEVLEHCHLKEHFQAQEKGLDTLLTDGGSNLSRGQAQLLCLGRALLHEAKVLVLDEATASVDVETDKLVQETIRKNFGERTIITIAHRLNTIMDSDRIIVLDGGEIKEFDTPQNLLNTEGLFADLHKAAKKSKDRV